ncbi:MAG TPA: KH domain-containing protein [Candidatus Acidoferrales bacterium]|nr:KH domain-containing protein [Candidatus Acidoferrales bacterium]
MSAFDDEFGLFGDEASPREDDERRSTLGARRISTGETVIDEIEPEDEAAPRRGRGGFAPRNGEFVPRRRPGIKRPPLADEIAHPRAVELLTFLAKKLVSKPDVVAVSLHPDDRGAVLELEVDPDDLGKVIGRGGRVAQALRTLVRASAEGRVTIDIVDSDEADLPDEAELSDEEDQDEAETSAESD